MKVNSRSYGKQVNTVCAQFLQDCFCYLSLICLKLIQVSLIRVRMNIQSASALYSS